GHEREFGRVDKNPAQLRLIVHEVEQIELRALLTLLDQKRARIDAAKILAVPITMIVALIGQRGMMPRGVTIVENEIEFQMDMRALDADSLASVRRAAHNSDLLTGFHALARLEPGAHFVQVGIQRTNLKAINLMPKDDVITVIRERRACVDVSDRPI